MAQSLLSQQRNDDSFENIWQELKWRQLVQVSTDEAALEEALTQGSLTFYTGYDPTAASLHLGHLVQLLLMRRLQLAGHKPLGLVGGATGLIGDPRQTSERVLNSPEVVAGWVTQLRTQIERFLDFEGEHAAQMVNNLDWTSELSAIDFLREIGKHFRVGSMIKKEIVAKRLNSDEGISYTEFSYQVLQGNDFRELNRRYGCTLQTGGSDQWGNLTSGTELIRKTEGVHVHAIGTPLITNADGTKFGKSEGNAIWLDPQLCSPYAFYQFWLNTADAEVIDRLKVFTFMSRQQIEEFEQELQARPHMRLAQKALAAEVTALVHGQQALEKVIAASEAMFGKGSLGDLDEATLAAATAELPHTLLTQDQLDLISVLTLTGLCESKSAARRTLKEGGASVNNLKVQGEDAKVTASQLLHGRYAVIRRGKKKTALIEVA